MITIYIAGASAELERCESFRDACRAMGYVVTFDWAVVRRASSKTDAELTPSERAEIKGACYRGAASCDVFVLLLPGIGDGDAFGMAPRLHTIGAWCELGYAEATRHQVTLGHGSREIIVVGESPERTVFAAGLPHYATDEAALRQLAEMIGAEVSDG